MGHQFICCFDWLYHQYVSFYSGGLHLPCLTVYLVVLGYRIPPNLERCAVLSPFLAILSPLWIFWDPTYSLQKRSIAQGRKIRVDGRKTYIVSLQIDCNHRTSSTILLFKIVQSVIWWSRLCTSCLLFTRCWRFECRSLPAEHHTFGSVTVKQLFFSSTLIIEVIVGKINRTEFHCR